MKKLKNIIEKAMNSNIEDEPVLFVLMLIIMFSGFMAAGCAIPFIVSLI